jgi:hypothetical protein
VGAGADSVSGVLQPVGPLPPSVYWRRRALVAGIVLLVIVLGWIALPGGGDDGGRRETAAAAGSPTATPTGAPTSLAATPPAGDPGRAGDGEPAATTTTAAPPPTTTPPPPPRTTRPAAPGPCSDRSLALRVAPERLTYAVGQQPVLDLQVRNVSKAACVRDLGAAQQEILVYRGSQRLWSSNDCYPEGEKRTEVLTPNAARSFEVTWSGLGSRPRCAGVRTRVGAGSYTLVARLGTLVSPRTPLTLR